jgi:glycosyltransferase involved in cell wall biosynthesis
MSRRRHILHVLPDGSPGGGTTAVLGLCRDLLATGAFDVSLVTAPGSALLERAEQEGIRTAALDFFATRLDPRLPRRLAEPIGWFRPDIVHAHGARAGLPLAGVGLRAATPLVYTVHGYHHANKMLPLRWLGRLAERHIAARADAVIFVSDGDRDRADREAILARTAPKAFSIPNGIDPADFVDLEPGAERFDLIFAGRAHPQKNPLFMVDILESLAGTGIRLLMIAGGPLEASLRARIAASPARDRISWVGALPRREVLRALRSARLLVLPSLWEGLPIAPIEALHLGLPVIASRIGGTREILVDGEHGRLIDGFDPQDYAGAIREVLDDTELYARLAQNGRRLVAERYLRRVGSAAHATLYEALLEQR